MTTPIPAPDGWTAQLYHGGEPGKDYVCPRCARGVSRTSQHVVAWPSDADDGHRHWHRACWETDVREGLDPYRWL